MEGKAKINLYTGYSHRQRTQQGVVVGNRNRNYYSQFTRRAAEFKDNTHTKHERVVR